MTAFLQWLARRDLTAFSRGKMKKSKKRFRPHFYHAKAGRVHHLLHPYGEICRFLPSRSTLHVKTHEKITAILHVKTQGPGPAPESRHPGAISLKFHPTKAHARNTPPCWSGAGQVQVRCRSGAGQVRSGAGQVRSGAGQVRSGAGQVPGQVPGQVRSGARSGQVRCIASQVRSGQVHCESGALACNRFRCCFVYSYIVSYISLYM